MNTFESLFNPIITFSCPCSTLSNPPVTFVSKPAKLYTLRTSVKIVLVLICHIPKLVKRNSESSTVERAITGGDLLRSPMLSSLCTKSLILYVTTLSIDMSL